LRTPSEARITISSLGSSLIGCETKGSPERPMFEIFTKWSPRARLTAKPTRIETKKGLLGGQVFRREHYQEKEAFQRRTPKEGRCTIDAGLAIGKRDSLLYHALAFFRIMHFVIMRQPYCFRAAAVYTSFSDNG